MNVEVSHNVGEVEGQVLNYLTYDFHVADGLVRARAFVNDMRQVCVLGRLNADGSTPEAVVRFQEAYTAAGGAEKEQIKAAQAAFEAMDPRNSSEFDTVLDYLVDRFPEIHVMGPSGPERVQFEVEAAR